MENSADHPSDAAHIFGIQDSVLIAFLDQERVGMHGKKEHSEGGSHADHHGFCLFSKEQGEGGKEGAGGKAHADSQKIEADQVRRPYIVFKEKAPDSCGKNSGSRIEDCTGGAADKDLGKYIAAAAPYGQELHAYKAAAEIIASKYADQGGCRHPVHAHGKENDSA